MPAPTATPSATTATTQAAASAATVGSPSPAAASGAASLRDLALAALCESDVACKLRAVKRLACELPGLAVCASTMPCVGDLVLPGRPQRPRLVDADAVPRRPAGTLAGRAAMVHAIAHIEFNAINLALDAVWRFNHMPDDFYLDWARVAIEEAQHFEMLLEHLHSMGGAAQHWTYGDFDAHDGLWSLCVATQDDVVARMGLVPRTLEARGLDATPQIQARLARETTPDARRICAILDTILRDEIGHVAIGNHWYHWLCAQRGLDPVAHNAQLAAHYAAPRPRPPFNLAARRAAGFTEQELDLLQASVTNTADAAAPSSGSHERPPRMKRNAAIS